MAFETLTLKSIVARPVVLRLARPVVARIATITEWPLILIDLQTEEGVTGRSYLEPYVRKSMRYLIPALHDLGEMLRGRRVAPVEFYDAARCHAIDDLGLAWIEEPIVYDNLEGYARLTAELKTPVQIGENFYGPRALYNALQMKACDYVMPDFMRIGGVTGWQRAAAIAAAAGIPISTHLYPEVAAHVMRVSETAHWLEWQDWADPILQRPYEIKAGKLHIPDVPGVGLEWDESAVAAHLDKS